MFGYEIHSFSLFKHFSWINANPSLQLHLLAFFIWRQVFAFSVPLHCSFIRHLSFFLLLAKIKRKSEVAFHILILTLYSVNLGKMHKSPLRHLRDFFSSTKPALHIHTFLSRNSVQTAFPDFWVHWVLIVHSSKSFLFAKKQSFMICSF